MSTGLCLRPGVLAAKARLAEGREKLRQRHAAGAPGIQVCNSLADLIDTIILELYEAALADLDAGDAGGLRSQIALVPHGGYGRRDVAPYSDVDLMLLCAPRAERQVVPLAQRLMRDVNDAGFTLGYSVRTPAQACRLASRDATICTSLVESRFLAGSVNLYARLIGRFQQHVRARWRRLLALTEQARSEERGQYGETVYLLEPNIKRSRGGLRDLHLLRWVGFIRYGAADPDSLQLRGELSPADHRTLRRARDFLLRLRNEMHFGNGKAHDVLDRAEQCRVAAAFDYPGMPAQLPVERFMQEYFRSTTDVSDIVSHFIAGAQPGHRWRAFWAPLLSHQVEGDFLVVPGQIAATRRGAEKLKQDLAQVLRLADLANLYDKRIAYAACEIIRTAAPHYSDRLSDEAGRRFLSILAQPARLGELLRWLHDVRVLERILPEFAHARCLLQFNEYHRYTVDEHCIRAVEQAVEFKRDRGLLGHVYRGIKQKRTLHLALLIHDLGKGYLEDHSELGLKIAADTATRLKLPPAEAELLGFLVHKHLGMAHLAFRRDTDDEQVVVRFAVEVGSPEALQMLFVLTAADFAAVGPGVWNHWKAEVLGDLYRRTLRHLTGDSSSPGVDERLEDRRAQARAYLRGDDPLHWFYAQIDSLPRDYLHSTLPAQIIAELRELHALPPGKALARGRYLSERGTTEYTVSTHEEITPGVFHKLTGGLTGQGLQILSAQINTLAEGLVLDRFWVHDPDYTDEPPPARIDAVCQSLVTALEAPDGSRPSFRRTWPQRSAVPLAVLPTRVLTDNSTSDRYTIVEVFTADRSGLLYRIARTLFELGLSVSLAKIATHLDQVLDVFYVTDQAGNKIDDETRLEAIKSRLLAEIEEVERQQAQQATAW